jgi:hypothetical protein
MKLRTWEQLKKKASPREALKIAVRQNLRYATAISICNISPVPLGDLMGRFPLNRRAKRVVVTERALGIALIGPLAYMWLERLF